MFILPKVVDRLSMEQRKSEGLSIHSSHRGSRHVQKLICGDRYRTGVELAGTTRIQN